MLKRCGDSLGVLKTRELGTLVHSNLVELGDHTFTSSGGDAVVRYT